MNTYETLLSKTEMEALRRFAECCEDSDSGGHDVPKMMMKRLASAGAVVCTSTRWGIYETTKFGNLLLDIHRDVIAPVPAATVGTEVPSPGSMPALPQHLLDVIGRYGCARSDSCNELEIQHRWETLIRCIKVYAASTHAHGVTAVDELSALRDQPDALSALAELVELKDMKDQRGKIPEYCRRQPAAWDRAREILARVQGTFACPICGKESPHQHTNEEIAKHRGENVPVPTEGATTCCRKNPCLHPGKGPCDLPAAPEPIHASDAAPDYWARKVLVPLTEPVSVRKAMLGGKLARVVLSGGAGHAAAVHLLNIGVSGWIYTKETAEAFARGFNMAAAWMQDAMEARPAPAVDAVHAAATPTTVSLEGLKGKLLAPRDLTRDEDGMLNHPDMPICDEGVRAEPFLWAFGIECRFVGMESDACDEYSRYSERADGNCSAWTPTPPMGDGWILVSIFDTEDGPFAQFIRDESAAPAVDAVPVHAATVTRFGVLHSTFEEPGFEKVPDGGKLYYLPAATKGEA